MAADDDSLEPAVRRLLVTDRQPRAPIAAMRYDVVGSPGYTVFEEGDRLAAGLSGAEAVATIAGRCRARVLDHLTLGGWIAARAGIAWLDHRRLLVVGAQHRASMGRLRSRGYELEGDELVFFRAGEAVCLPRPCSSRVELGPLDGVVLASDESVDDPAAPIGTGDAVQVLLAATITRSAPLGAIVAECVALVGHGDVYRSRARG